MRLLVTGGAGFLGSHFVRSVLADRLPGLEGAQVTVLDALTYAGNPTNLDEVRDHAGFRFVHGDIADPQQLAVTLPGHHVVVNFAAESHVDRSISAAAPFVRTNVWGVQMLLDGCLAAGVPRLLQVSTDEVYGTIDSGSWSEDQPVRPNSPYAASKAAADLLVLAAGRTHDLAVRITRGSNAYGPRQHPEKLIPRFLCLLLEGQNLPLFGDGLNVREWVHVEDHCRGIATVLTAGADGEVYNLGGGTALTNRDLTQRLLDACGAGWDRVDHVADRKAHDRRYSVDSAKLTALGYAPTVPFEIGLADTIAWYRDNRTSWQPATAAVPG